ncbi:MAG: hypothetical protein RBS80_23115 [Thermoguttaceae bacterium]|jgi:hypothetical protein|nr:hypothetical protein [Thermoguttaceae bacterium]
MLDWNRFVIALAATASIPLACEGTTRAAETSAAPAPADAERIAGLVEQLDSDSFAERQAASDKLAEFGRPAIEALAKAALGDSLEVTVRSIDILRSMLQSNDEPTREAAKAALEGLAKGPRTGAARRAAQALKPPEEPPPPAAQLVPGIPGAAIQIAVAGARRVNVRIVDGVKTIEAEEADKKVKIVDDPNQGIKMEVATKKDGKDVVETYEAKNAEELKKQHPDAYKTYSQYSQMGGGGAIAVQMQIGGNAQAVPIPIQQAVPIPVQPDAPIDAAARILSSWGATLDRLATDEAIRRASRESNEELKKKVGEIKKQLDRLEKRLQEATAEPDPEP